ncbi:hypothetical protein AA12717_1847 [Gluconacetobacter sacchari DSM 12717]|nr:hypothetical protein AA12717_1847 [Gluconacetobacter sacchari DSM 12717]
MLIPRLSFGKLVHVSSILMTLLLAMNMHALAGHLKNDTIEADDPAAQAVNPPPQAARSQTTDAPESRASDTRNAIEGWTSIVSVDDHDIARQTSATPPETSGAEAAATAATPGQGTDPEVTKAETALIRNIVARQSTFDTEQKSLEEQKRIIDAAQSALNEKMRDLDSTMAALAERQAAHRETMSAETDRLVRIYEEMPPKEAAAVFNIMDIHVLVSVANRMNPRKISAVMGYMMPERVNIVSQYMAGIRTFHPLRAAFDGTTGQPAEAGALSLWSRARPDARPSDSDPLKLSRQ